MDEIGEADLTETYGGLDYTDEDSAEWMIEAGFQQSRKVNAPEPH
ncbi:MAG: hypothetical protein ACYCZT_02055 [Thiobacillus sp.]